MGVEIRNVTIDEVMGYTSGDFGVVMSRAFEAQIKAWNDFQAGLCSEWFIHSAEREYGGPEAYKEYLTEVMRVKGWVGPPLTVSVYPSGKHRVNNGHHRFIAARPAGLERIPGRFYTMEDEY